MPKCRTYCPTYLDRSREQQHTHALCGRGSRAVAVHLLRHFIATQKKERKNTRQVFRKGDATTRERKQTKSKKSIIASCSPIHVGHVWLERPHAAMCTHGAVAPPVTSCSSLPNLTRSWHTYFCFQLIHGVFPLFFFLRSCFFSLLPVSSPRVHVYLATTARFLTDQFMGQNQSTTRSVNQ